MKVISNKEVTKVLDTLCNKLAAAGKDSIHIRVDAFPLVGLSDFPYTIVRMVPRNSCIAQFFAGRREEELIGFSFGPSWSCSREPQLRVIDQTVFRILSETDLQKTAHQLSLVTSTSIPVVL